MAIHLSFQMAQWKGLPCRNLVATQLQLAETHVENERYVYILYKTYIIYINTSESI